MNLYARYLDVFDADPFPVITSEMSEEEQFTLFLAKSARNGTNRDGSKLVPISRERFEKALATRSDPRLARLARASGAEPWRPLRPGETR